ncbi:MAG: BACON domain-containing protein [Synergistaceae bacterium]|nr:BACON domain-containing protein [Synergistaceae bacterium]MBQ9596616.1 BACON domain-containing protein [Synergistaceae bacterium]
MRVNFFWREGFCFGEGEGVTWSGNYEWDGGRRYPRFDKYGVVNLDMPKHSWVEMKTFDIDAKGDKSAGLGFSVLSEGSWTVSSDVDWITFTETSGSATGENQYPIRFQVAENNGSPRIGTIKFTAKVGDNLTEETELKVNQAGK